MRKLASWLAAISILAININGNDTLTSCARSALEKLTVLVLL
jgi:hypothetical protein